MTVRSKQDGEERSAQAGGESAPRGERHDAPGGERDDRQPNEDRTAPGGEGGGDAAGPRVWIDGRSFAVEPGTNLLHACLSLGFDLPYFCWHPALGSVGACRQCAVKQFRDENDDRGRLVMACMTGADDGVRISIEDAEARELRREVVEWLMTNHPHDCPVCDEGGECHLQDMTVMTGHAVRRYRFAKRTFRNQYLGPFLNHEMNRCITCYRCVRFYRDYAGGRDLEAQASHHWVYFGRQRDGVLESEFAGNLAEVCPTGVFTDKTLGRHYVRKWDLTHAPSICPHCAVGCNVLAGEREGALRRIQNRYHSEVNGYFLCDRGRFGYEFVNDARRLRTPLARGAGGNGGLGEIDAREALERFSELVAGGGLLGIASPRASLESSFALARLVGRGSFSSGMGDAEASLLARQVEILRRGPAASASLADVRRADAVLVLGEDPTMTAPVLALALRQAALVAPFAAAPEAIPRWHDAAMREHAGSARSPFWIAAPFPTRLDDVATASLRVDAREAAALARAVARALRGGGDAGEVRGERDRPAAEIARALDAAGRPLIVAGTASGSRELLDAAAEIATALGERARLALVAPESNSVGAALLGGGLTLGAALDAAERGEIETLVVVENDLYRRAARARVDRALAQVAHLVVLDHLPNATVERAELVLPAAAWAEADGTLVSYEGRAQRFFQVLPPQPPLVESWRWLGEAAAGAGVAGAGPWRVLDEVAAELAREHPELAPIRELGTGDERAPGRRALPRQPHRWSGRTAIVADRTLHEPAPPRDPDSRFVFSMEGSLAGAPGRLLPFYWWPRWNSVQSLNKFQEEVAGPLAGGEAGVRLLEPTGESAAGAASSAPVTPSHRDPRPESERGGAGLAVRLVAMPQIFGSEELSAAAPAVAERAPAPFVALGAADAGALGVLGGEPVDLRAGGAALRLPVRVEPSIAAGIAGLPVGLAGVPWIDLPAAGEVTRP